MELQNLGAVVGRLEAELAEIRSETEQQQQERAHLLACKSQLQKDVASYHALLDREESKYVSLLPYLQEECTWRTGWDWEGPELAGNTQSPGFNPQHCIKLLLMTPHAPFHSRPGGKRECQKAFFLSDS